MTEAERSLLLELAHIIADDMEAKSTPISANILRKLAQLVEDEGEPCHLTG